MGMTEEQEERATVDQEHVDANEEVGELERRLIDRIGVNVARRSQ